ncbi:hypothetical protein AERO_18170 [Aeromicrobium fastidiosum]|uniref:hypothetical protein n=1 Tax=Aeromicrobium fastidiosum TaxID=52699 RepID=UPI002023558C|nr:hypothetical protein [Aeromicrobium fastidiosum]MCL8253310.1 hypothetical protein [Aeromicrobium fastidiosum]
MSPDAATVWVIGSGGLLGHAVTAAARGAAREVRTVRVPWHDRDPVSYTHLRAHETVAKKKTHNYSVNNISAYI